MMRTLLTVVAAGLATVFGLSCGGSPSQPSVSSLLELVPRNADAYTFANVDGLLGEGLDDLVDQIEILMGPQDLERWDVDYRDVSSLLAADSLSDDALLVLRGDFFFDDIQDALDDDGFRERTRGDITVWRNRRGRVAVAFVGEDVLVFGEEDRVNEAVDVFT